MQASLNPEQEEKFFHLEDYKSKVTDDLLIVGTENKDSFSNTYLQGQIRQSFKLIGTHSDAFHCDEALATSMLLWTEEFKKSIIVRSRDQELLDQLDVQCDVGAVFDPAQRRFDHHQKTFEHTWWTDVDNARAAEKQKLIAEGKQEEADALPDHRKSITKLSSAGLIYMFYGKEVIRNICKQEYEKELSQDELDHVHQKIYSSLIEEIDAIDNGVNVADDTRYHISTNLSSRVGVLNSPWNAPKSVGFSQHIQFKKAMRICEQQFIEKVYGQVNILIPARRVVLEAFNNREKFHPSKEFIWFDKTCPWKEHLNNIEKENKIYGSTKFVFFKDGRGMYRIQAVSVGNSFANRVSIHKDYRGLRGDELSKAAGITDGEFVHAAGFIGGAWSLESVIKMAEESLKQHEVEQKAKNEQLEQAILSGKLDLEKKQKVEQKN